MNEHDARTLLPPSSTLYERNLAQVMAKFFDVDIPLRTLWNPDTCPVDLLPYLAWAFSVYRWDEKWDEATRRKTIRDSFFLHQHKGTISALRRAVEPMGYLISVTEWWQNDKPPGTFEMEVAALDTGITVEMYAELARVINDAKPCSRHMTMLTISMETRGKIPVAAAAYDGDIMTVYPYYPDSIDSGMSVYARAAVHVIDTMEIFS
ncbi:phage tail protein I [Enterobacter ludwigii]|uniref:phage tail protein I n=1 Tax=Enterobacter ludwigii TaxID=299767 RepID=UPI003BEECA52